MARPSRSVEIETALLQAVSTHPRDLVGMVAAQLGLSTARISMQVRALAAKGYLDKSGSTRPTYALGRNRRSHRDYLRAGLAEDSVWFEHLLPLLRDLRRNVRDIAHHGVTEMVNNAIDHSDAKRVTVHMDLRDGHLFLAVADNGIGIFRKIAVALNLPDQRLALLELSKGKFTTDPRNHSGEGVFFTSRMFDNFQIVSGGLIFDHDRSDGNDVLFDIDDAPQQGTVVYMAIDAESKRIPAEVFNEYSSGPDDYTFAKTVVPVRLAQVGDENLVSRSQAKRLLQRVDKFRHVVLDFDRVRSVGQAFADEIFRVFANAHPEVELVTIHALPEVQQMIRRAETARDQDGGQLPLI
ncbi:MAG: STAS-like domain-containing protein [Rudaea sp.]